MPNLFGIDHGVGMCSAVDVTLPWGGQSFGSFSTRSSSLTLRGGTLGEHHSVLSARVRKQKSFLSTLAGGGYFFMHHFGGRRAHLDF